MALCEVTTVLATGAGDEDQEAVSSVSFSLASPCAPLTLPFLPIFLLPCQPLRPRRDITAKHHICGLLDCLGCYRASSGAKLYCLGEKGNIFSPSFIEI